MPDLTKFDSERLCKYHETLLERLIELPDRGPVNDTVEDILGGVRSACTYIGAKRLKDMPKCATFVRCTHQVNQVFNKFNAS